jgi:hypothetical protein
MTSCATAGRERERTRARRARGEWRSPNMGASVEKRMVAGGEIVVLSCKIVVILMVLNVARRQQWREFCHFGLQKKFDAWRCTRSRADGGIKVVKRDV